MLAIFVLISLVFVVNHISPKLGDVIAWMIVVGFLFPLLTFGGGCVALFVVNLLSGFSSWNVPTFLGCCAFFGFPFALLVGIFILKD